MSILLFHQYFRTPDDIGGVTGIRPYKIGLLLSEYDEVTVICGDSGYRKISDNFVSIGTASTDRRKCNKMGFWKRVNSFVDYNLKSFWMGMKIKKVKLIYASSSPLTVGIPAVILSKLKRCKLIFEVRDVWPDAPIELGFIKNPFLKSFLRLLEKWIYKNADHIVVASEGMKNNLFHKKVPLYKLSVITNFAETEVFEKITEPEMVEMKRKFGLMGKFICIHPGTMGFVNGLGYILDVAKQTIDDKAILYLLIGDGKEKSFLKERVKKENITNVIIADSVSKRNIDILIKASDVGLMPVRPYRVLELNSANKYFDYLAAGLPILLNYGGWQKQDLEDSGAGYSCSSSDPSDMARKIVEIKKNNLKLEMGTKGVEWAKKYYSTDVLYSKLRIVLSQLGLK